MKDHLSNNFIGNVITLFSLEASQSLYSEVGLKLSDPNKLRSVCFDSAKSAKDAYFDDGEIYGWVRDYSSVCAHFIEQFTIELEEHDLKQVKKWFSNGYDCLQQSCPVKSIWFSSLRWARNLNNPPETITPDGLKKIKELWDEIREEIYSDHYENARIIVSNNANSQDDEFIKNKFHLNISGDLEQSFAPIDCMREGNILVRHFANINPKSELYQALNKLPLVWWDANPDRRKYLKFDIHVEPGFKIGELVR